MPITDPTDPYGRGHDAQYATHREAARESFRDAKRWPRGSDTRRANVRGIAFHRRRRDYHARALARRAAAKPATPDYKGFAREMLNFTDGVLEGDDLQDIAVRHGLLDPTTVYEPCGEICPCAAYFDDDDFEAGACCYRVNADLVPR